MISIQWVLLELKRLLRNRFATLAAVVILIVPLLYSFFYLYAFWDPYSNLKNMNVAVVNLDQAAKKDNQTVSAGKDLVQKLKDDDTVGWKFTDQQDAMQGLSQSQYDLVLVIPKDFSQTILDTTKDPAVGKESPKATLLYYSNPSNNFLTEQIGNKVTSKVQSQLNAQISGKFIDNIFGNLEDMNNSLQTAADGSSDLQDGITSAYTGSGEITEHLGDAADGSNTLNDGLKSLADGSVQLGQGADDLLDGSQKLSDGANTIKDGVDDALSGTDELADGSDELVDGLAKAQDSLDDAADGSDQIYTGLVSAYTGSSSLTTGLASALTGSGQLVTGSDQLYKGLNKMKTELNDTSAGVPALISGLTTLANSIRSVADSLFASISSSGDLNNANNSISEAKNALVQAKNTTGDTLTASDIDDIINDLDDAQTSIAAHSGTVKKAAKTLYGIQSSFLGSGSSTTSVTAGLQTLLDECNSGLKSLIAGEYTVYSGLGSLNTGLTTAYSGSSTLTQGLATLKEGSKELSSGLNDGSSDFTELVSGGKSLRKGLHQLKTGMNDLDDGMMTYTSKMGEFVQGTIDLQKGTQDLNDGTAQAANGSASLLDGLNKLRDGSSSLTDGLNQAVSGSSDLTSGLKDGVTELQEDLPQNSSTVSEAMGEPVEVEENQIHPVNNYGTGFAPYFIPLSLWVGALLLFFLINLKENSLLVAGVSKVNILLGKFAIFSFFGALQAVISSFVLLTFLGLKPQNIYLFYVFNILQAIVYVAIIFFFVELFDMAGRFVAILLLILQLTAGEGTFPNSLVPKFFQLINPYLPMTYGIAALRNIISGSANIPLHTSVLVLVGFAAGALLLAIILIPKRIRVKDLHPSPQLGE